VGTSYKVALEDPAKISLYKLTSGSYGATQVQHFSCTAAEEKQQLLSKVFSLREVKTSPSMQRLLNNSTVRGAEKSWRTMVLF